MYQSKEGANPFEYMLNTKVQIVTTDGRIFVGVLRGIDQALNCVMQESEERVYSLDEGIRQLDMGLQVIRGDTVALIGDVDQEIEDRLNFEGIRAAPLPPILN